MLKDLSDAFVENPSSVYPIGTLVEGRIQSIDHVRGFVSMNLKPSVVVGNRQAKVEVSKYHEGDVVTGIVDRVNDTIGVFVRLHLPGSNVTSSLVGLSRKATALSSDDVQSGKGLGDVYHVGDIVKAKILRIVESSMKIALGLSANYFRDSDELMEESEEEEEEEAEEEDDGEDVEGESEDDEGEDDGEDEEEEGGKNEGQSIDDDDEGEVVTPIPTTVSYIYQYSMCYYVCLTISLSILIRRIKSVNSLPLRLHQRLLRQPLQLLINVVK